MKNQDIAAIWRYHDDTKHSSWSIRNNPHRLDWANRPLPFKIYPTIAPLRLSRDLPQTGVAAISAISESLLSPSAKSVPDLEDLARILYFTAGITKQREHPGGVIYFRAAACTGALYEIELYATGDLPGLDAGAYHFNPADQIFPSRFTRRKIAPPLMAAAVVHSSTARFAHSGTGTVRMCFPLPIRSAITQCSSRTWKSPIPSPTSSARRRPHPMSSARIARSRLPRRLSDGGSPSKVLD